MFFLNFLPRMQLLYHRGFILVHLRFHLAHFGAIVGTFAFAISLEIFFFRTLLKYLRFFAIISFYTSTVNYIIHCKMFFVLLNCLDIHIKLASALTANTAVALSFYFCLFFYSYFEYVHVCIFFFTQTLCKQLLLEI